jgi:hypothetical protein
MSGTTINSKNSANTKSTTNSRFYIDEDVVEAFLRSLMYDKFVLISAAKGAGVSTFLKYVVTTIQERVRAEHSKEDQDFWKVLTFRPGLHPIKSLVRALSQCDFSDAKKSINFEQEAEQLLNASNSLGLVELFSAYPVREKQRLLLIVDPLDDLFLFEERYQDEEINRFINLLYTFPQHSSLEVYVVIAFSNSQPSRTIHYAKLLDLLYQYKFKFTGPQLEDIPTMVRLYFRDLPAVLEPQVLYLQEQLKKDLEKYRLENLWKYLLQLTLKNFEQEYLNEHGELNAQYTQPNASLDWSKYYQKIGGVDSLIDTKAERIRSQLSPEDQLLCQLMFRSQINRHGDFDPIYFQTMVEILSSAASRLGDFQTRLENLVRIFVQDLELLELVQPLDVLDRGVQLTKDFKLSPGTVILFRNSFFKSQWRFFTTCVENKIKLVLDYEWYSRMAQNQVGEQYPLSLQPYAMAQLRAPDTLKNAEFDSLNTILELSASWIKQNIGALPSHQEELEQTKTFIRKGIAYWKKAAEDEAREKKRIARRKERLILSGFAAVLILGFLYILVGGMQDRMQDDYERTMEKNMYVRSQVDSLFANYIKIKGPGETRENVLKTKSECYLGIKRSLKYRPDTLDVDSKHSYQFVLNYFGLKEKQAQDINKIQETTKRALTTAVDSFAFFYFDSIPREEYLNKITWNVDSLMLARSGGKDDENNSYRKFQKKFPGETNDTH